MLYTVVELSDAKQARKSPIRHLEDGQVSLDTVQAFRTFHPGSGRVIPMTESMITMPSNAVPYCASTLMHITLLTDADRVLELIEPH